MLGNLSQTIVKVPKFFNLLTKLSSEEFTKTRYREPPLLDTFSQLKRINSNINKRYFKFSDHFKEDSLYKDLNFNNNKKYLSPVTKLPIRTFQFILFSENDKNSIKLKRNNSQAQMIPKANINSINSNNIIIKDNSKKTINTNNNINIENKRYDNINENQIGNNNNENNDNKNNDDNNNIEENDEEKKIKKYMQKLRYKKPNNIKELKEFLDINYIEKRKNILPKIKRLHMSISQDDLFKKTIDKKIESFTTIRPEIKNSIFKRKKNFILQKDYDLFQKIKENHPFRFKNNINNIYKNYISPSPSPSPLY